MFMFPLKNLARKGLSNSGNSDLETNGLHESKFGTQDA